MGFAVACCTVDTWEDSIRKVFGRKRERQGSWHSSDAGARIDIYSKSSSISKDAGGHEMTEKELDELLCAYRDRLGEPFPITMQVNDDEIASLIKEALRTGKPIDPDVPDGAIQ
jgi:hypothetical protein